jgi:hypothetical protein
MAGDKPGERNGGRLRLLFDMFNEVWKDILMKFCFQCFGTIDEALRFEIEGAFTGRLRQLKGRMGLGGGLVWKVVDRCDWRGSRFERIGMFFNFLRRSKGAVVEHSRVPQMPK